MKISASTAATIATITVSLILTSFTISDAVAQQANTATSNSSLKIHGR
ncbi:MAG TPA: hypothetical protein VKA09_16040 [Nitrososphaeraceae archaeon]|jgi:hypothetical protein|nr:hypothetical protein [Nitrososphaeraceae archaeon]